MKNQKNEWLSELEIFSTEEMGRWFEEYLRAHRSAKEEELAAYVNFRTELELKRKLNLLLLAGKIRVELNPAGEFVYHAVQS